MLEDHPWAAQYLNTGQPSKAPDKATDEVLPQSVEGSAAFEEAWSALEQARADWRQEPSAAQGEQFVASFRSGDWNLINRGVNESDRIVAQAQAGPARTWCQRYGVNVMASFSFSRYGEKSCRTLALEWCRRLQFFFDIWRHQDDSKYVYTDSDLKSYTAQPDWQAFVASLSLASDTLKRANVLSMLVPTNPVP